VILEAAGAAFVRLFSAEFRRLFLKSLGLTLLIIVVLWIALERLVSTLALPWIGALLPGSGGWDSWFGLIAGILAGVALALGLALLIGPVTAIVAGFFLDDVAEIIEREDYPADPPGQPLPWTQALGQSMKFFGVVIIGNLAALFMLLLPGLNIAAFFLVNGYLLGREFFEFAAMRFLAPPEARALRRRHAGTVFLAGLVIAAFLAVPLLNLLTPLFAAAMMVHVNKRVLAAEAGRGGRQT